MPHENQMDEVLQTNLIEATPIPRPLPGDPIRRDRVSGGLLPRRRKFAVSYAALAAVFGAFLILAGGVGTALAADDDDDEPFDKKLLGKFMHALGFVNGTEPGFNYQERPPLVVPPTRELPPPETTGAIAARDPAWPVDPDVARQKAEKKARAERRNRNLEQDSYRNAQPLSPAEMAAAGKTSQPRPPSAVNQPDYLLNPMTPSELGFTNSMFKDFFGLGKAFSNEPENGTFVREPPRVSLTDPPSGYRTPSPEQPYGTRNKRDVNAKQLGDRQTEGTQRQ
jgi:hypothetical protein